MCSGERRTCCTCRPRAPRTHSYLTRLWSAWPAAGRSRRTAGRSNPLGPSHRRTDHVSRCHRYPPTPSRGPHRSPAQAPEAEVAAAAVEEAAAAAAEEAAAAAAAEEAAAAAAEAAAAVA